MKLFKTNLQRCPSDIIAIAINENSITQHCGIVFTSASSGVLLCHMAFEKQLWTHELPGSYYWTPVTLDEYEVMQISAFVDLVIERERTRQFPYSTIYSADGFDAIGEIRDGVGFTYATFVVAIFDRFKLPVVNLATWKARPRQDARFRDRVARSAEERGQFEVASRLRAETQAFRLKPWELFGSATHIAYPVKFHKAKKLAKIVTKLVRERCNRNPELR